LLLNRTRTWTIYLSRDAQVNSNETGDRRYLGQPAGPLPFASGALRALAGTQPPGV